MTGKNKSFSHDNVDYSESEDGYQLQVSETESDIHLEKLNLGPRKKLLIMNLNGLLLCRTNRRNKEEIPRHNIDAALNHAIGALKSKLLFVWDQDRCTNSGFKSLEIKFKPLFFKELSKVWDNVKKGGPYSASNTLLIDDKPYKALLNPLDTAIFPEPYKPKDEVDRVLDPKGELCLYLKGLADAHDVQSYVKEHPFGQPAITSSHPDWEFYSQVQACLRRKN
ncbi:hypothetical protein VNO77_17739 [Canavalia gladiata]|uniref:Mitochondrial import inner membrane translocase subunit TIM50 n=1 Tax=Canavalia gladiata TaxID=3824 RepID=A0AAN9LNB9_CANGL